MTFEKKLFLQIMGVDIFKRMEIRKKGMYFKRTYNKLKDSGQRLNLAKKRKDSKDFNVVNDFNNYTTNIKILKCDSLCIHFNVYGVFTYLTFHINCFNKLNFETFLFIMLKK